MLQYETVHLLERVQRLYDDHCFLKAFRESAQYWKCSTDPNQLSVQELILGGRLAARLGGWRLSRWLFRAARERDASNPRVRYFSNHLRRRRWRLLDELRDFQTNPIISHDDAEIQAAWLASHAVTWAMLRDFKTAHSCLERAQALETRDGWVLCCKSDVFGLEDRWEEALESAEKAWEVNPGAPFAARSLGNSLLNLRRIEESARRLATAAEYCESYEITHLACWYNCALAETLDGDARRRTLQTCHHLANRFEVLAPLADRECRSLFARTWLDIAELSDDHEQMERWAKEVRSPFHRRMLDHLRKNPSGSRIRLPFPQAIQKYEACLPTSLASALTPLGIQIDPDNMAAEITFGGTPEWAAADWLEKRGLAVRFFITTPEVATALIRNGIGFVFTLEGDDSAHAVAAVGLDEAAGTLLVHDPQAFRTAEYLLESLGENHEPWGFRGMAAVPPEKALLLDQLLPRADVEVMSAVQQHRKAGQLHGPTAAREVVNALAKSHPSHAVTRLLQAVQAGDDGRTGEALAGLQEMLKQFPHSPFLRARLLATCRSVGNTALLRETLAGVVDRGVLPGMQAEQEWLHPPARYVCDYADLLRLSDTSHEQARGLLHAIIRRQPTYAGAWHILADLLWRERDRAGALLCYRISSCLASNSEHYALGYCDAIGKTGREQEGLAWLEARVRALGATSGATGPWISWVAALENWGHPDRALTACRLALEKHGEASELLAFAIPFLGRMGLWQEAENLLDRLASLGNLGLLHEAAVDFYRMRADLHRAIEHAEAWVREVPRHMGARHALLDLVSRQDGPRVAVQRATRWLADYPGHDELEELYYHQLERAGGPQRKKYSLLFRRVKRNSEDGWAWRELAFSHLSDYQSAEEKRRNRLAPRILALLLQCDRTAPQDPATFRVHAYWHQVNGEWSEAVADWLESINREPSNFYGYRQIWECSAAYEASQRQNLWNQVEPILLGCPGRLTIARDMVMLVAQRFGVAVAEQSASRWVQTRPDDPDVTEAFADLLLEYGHGRSDAERALAILQPAIRHFPYHVGLHFSLVSALRKLAKFTEAESLLREIMHRHPGIPMAAIQLAWIHELRGEDDEARKLLESAAAADPQNTQIPDALAQILMRNGQFENARTLITDTLRRLPEDVSWRARAVRLLSECGDAEGAVQAAQEGIQVYPRGAYLWFLLGTALNQMRRFAAQGQIENCFRRALALNQTLFDAADHLAMLLVEQRRYEEASKVMDRVRLRLSDPSPALGRVAWIHRQQGRKAEARDQMADTVRAVPWYRWGWMVLIDWLAEDAAWDQARALLGAIPPELRTDTQFRRQRLHLLEKAGLPSKELDLEWADLLKDFPEDVPLHLDRYDSLREVGRLPEAASVLDAIRSIDPDNPFVLARLVEVFGNQQKKDEAIDTLPKIFFARTESSAWPVEYAWDALKKVHWEEPGYQKTRSLMQEGSRPTPAALATLASHALQRGKTCKISVQPYWRTWVPDRGAKELRALLRIVDGATWQSGAYRAILLQRLSDFGYQRLVLRYWKRNRALIESQVESWAETARALVGLHRTREARELLSGWHERRGVGMWVVANYITCLRGFWPSRLRQIRSTCCDALAGLPHDHCARFLVHVQAEASALLGDTQGLLETWQQHRSYFDCKESGNEWFQSERRHLLADIPTMVRYLEQNELGLYRKTVCNLRWQRLRDWLGGTGFNLGHLTSLPWWTWLLLLFVLGQLLRSL